MNSRERVLRARDHQELDRVPIDLGATLGFFDCQIVTMFNPALEYGRC